MGVVGHGQEREGVRGAGNSTSCGTEALEAMLGDSEDVYLDSRKEQAPLMYVLEITF